MLFLIILMLDDDYLLLVSDWVAHRFSLSYPIQVCTQAEALSYFGIWIQKKARRFRRAFALN